MDWAMLLEEQFSASYYKDLQERVAAARAVGEVYPSKGRELFALEATPAESVRVVILGQDPYHQPGQAMGLAFSVAKGCPLPPSLRNIYKELEDDIGLCPASHGDLTAWAEEGVLLLNTVLTVDRGSANSHADFGWQRFTDAVIEATDRLPQPIVFLLWGSQARKKAALLKTDAPRLILTAPHPSPLSSYRGFFGCRHFSQANAFLKAHGAEEISWQL